MKKLRKDNGGYALVYVLIVVLVLCAVAVSVCTAALKNYQAQERSIRQTQQLYQAEGEIEKLVALAEAVSNVSSLTVSGTYVSENAATENAGKDKAKDAAKKAYKEYLNSLASESSPPDTGYSDSSSCKFTLTYKNDTVCIKTEIKMNLEYEVKIVKRETLLDGTQKITYTANVSKATHHYITYTITHLTAERGAGG